MTSDAKRDDRTSGEKLIDAIRRNAPMEVDELIAGSADVNEIPEEESPMAVAAEVGNEAIVDALLRAGADPSMGGLSVPLASAVWQGHEGIVRKLLDAGAQVDDGSEEGTTPLMVAARKGRLHFVKILVDAGADPQAIDSEGRAAIHYAKDHPDVVAFLKPLSAGEQVDQLEPKPIRADASDVNAPDENGRTAFYHAVHALDLARAQQLFAAGANIDQKDDYGQTPVMAAVGNEPANRAMIQWLAQSGADLRAKDEYGQTVLSLATYRYFPPDGLGEEEDQQALRKLFFEIGLLSESAEQLNQAAGNGDFETVKELLAAGTDVDATDEQDRTPLWMAVTRRRPEVVALLLRSKADPNKPIGGDGDIDIQYGGRMKPCPKCGKPFMSMTWTRACPACAHTFDSRKVFPDSPHGLPPMALCWANYWTPLMGAARMNDLTLAGRLLDAGAKIEVGRGDCTPLMGACAYGHVEMAKFLIDRGAKVNAVCKQTGSQVTTKLTALDIVAEMNNLDLLELLWSAGAKSEDKDTTRLVAAAGAGDVKRVEKLLQSGVDVNAIDPFSRNTAVYAASVNGQPETLRALLEARGSIVGPKRGVAPLLMASSAICEGLPRNTKTPDDVPRYVETIKLLIGAGASVNVKMFGMSPLSLAKDANCKPLVELFEAAAAATPATKAKRKNK